MATTIYDIKVRYLVNDKASKALGGIDKAARKSAQGTDVLSKSLKRMMAVGAGFFTFKLAKSLLIDYNAELEQARIQMGGLLQMNIGGSWATNQKRANRLVKEFTEDAKKSTATTKDFVDLAGMLTGPLSRAGASLTDIREITKGAVIASRAFGMETEFAARDIEQALAGTLGRKDRFARALLEPMGYTTEKWNEMIRGEPTKALDALVKTFNQPAIKNMAKTQEKSWAGTMSTLKDNLQRTFGKIGLPLMKKISAEFDKLNQWFEKNPEKVNEIAKSVSDALIKGFYAVREGFRFVVRHKSLLMLLAKAVLLSKGIGMVQSIAQPLLSGLNSLNSASENTAGAVTKFGGKLGGLLSNLGRAAGILGTVAVGAKAIADYVDARQEKDIKKKTEASFAVESAQALSGMGGAKAISSRRSWAIRAEQRGLSASQYKRIGASKTYRAARDTGLITQEGTIDVAKLAQRYGGKVSTLAQARTSAEMRTRIEERQAKMKAFLGSSGGGMTKQEKWMIKAMEGLELAIKENTRSQPGIFSKFGTQLKEMFPEGTDPADKRRKPAIKPNVTVNQKVTVVSDDPDRIAYAMVGAFKDAVSNPTQSNRVYPER